MTSFLITGLPRSRTAWMSVVASSVPGAMCYHEPMARLKRWECCFDIWRRADYPHVGVSDAHLGFHLTRIIAEAGPRILVIRRDVEKVKESLLKIGGPHSNYCDVLAESLNRSSGQKNVAWVNFDSLRDLKTVTDCLRHLMPDCAIDDDRIRELIDLNIQTDMELVWQRALESRTASNQILGADVMPGIKFFQ